MPFKTFLKKDFKLRMDLAPVLTVTGPFLCDIDHCQIQHFQKAVIRGKYRLRFRYFPKLPIESFDGIRCIDQAADCFRILEISRQIRPVLVPGLRQ